MLTPDEYTDYLVRNGWDNTGYEEYYSQWKDPLHPHFRCSKGQAFITQKSRDMWLEKAEDGVI